MGSVVVERRGPKDDEELFRLYGDVFGTPLADSSRRRWRWQYLENPANSGGVPEIWVARDGDALLGQYASMPVRLWWGGREVRSSWGMDVFLRPEARGRGVGAQLFTTWSDHVEVALGLGLTPSSHGLFQKLRYEDVGPVPFFQKVLDPRAVAIRRLGPALGPLAAPLLKTALAVVAPEVARAEGVAVRRIESFGDEYDVLWEQVRSSYAMCVRRDRAYLNWKYVACPHRAYDRREARRGAELAGYAVSRHEDYQGTRLGWIVDVFTASDDGAAQDALLASILDDFQRAGVARVQCFAMNAGLGRALKRRGFLASRSPMQFCVRDRVGPREVVAERGRWHVTFGDSDMDR